MNQDEIFRKLTRGVKFDRTRYREDAENLGLVPKLPRKVDESAADPKSSIFITEMDHAAGDKKYEICESFDKINQLIKRNMAETLQWKTPTRIQMAAIPVLLGT